MGNGIRAAIRAMKAWGSCHHRGYGTVPTAGELRVWLASVARVGAAFE